MFVQIFRISHCLRVSRVGDDVLKRFVLQHKQHYRGLTLFRLRGEHAVRELQDVHRPQPLESYMTLLADHAV